MLRALRSYECNCVQPHIRKTGPLCEEISSDPKKKGSRKKMVCGWIGKACDFIDYYTPDNIDGPKGVACCHGSVQYVLQGDCPGEVLGGSLNVNDYRYIFLAGTTAEPGNELGIGEMVAFNGKGYVRSTRVGTDEYFKTLSNSHIRAPAAFGIQPANAVPDMVAKTTYGGMGFASAINDIFAQMNKKNKAPAVAFGGLVNFTKFVGGAVAVPAIEKEDLIANIKKYYPYPDTEIHGATCVVFGLAGDLKAVENAGITNMPNVLYAGASSPGGGAHEETLALHCHCVTLRDTCQAKTAQEIEPHDVIHCFHLDAVKSICGAFELELFSVAENLHEVACGEYEKDSDETKPVYGTCSEWICNALADAGVTHVYGGHGGALAPLVNAVVSDPRLTWVCTRNEANASLMAAAHAKLTGELGCCIATSGPGATNLTTGLFDAQLDEVPMIAITGLKPRAGLGYSEFQDFPQSRMFQSGGLPFSLDVASPEALAPLMRDGVAKALTMRTCVHLAVPVDIQAGSCPQPIKEFCAASARSHLNFPDVHDYVLDNVVSELQVAGVAGGSRIVIGIGHRCVDAGPDILKLAELIRAPVFTRLDAKGCVNECHPLAMGCLGVHGKAGLERAARLIETSTLVLVFGCHSEALLLANKAGLQVRPMILFEPDAACAVMGSNFRSLYDVIGNTKNAVKKLVAKLEAQGVGKPSKEAETKAQKWAKELRHSGLDTASPDGHSISGPRTTKASPPDEDFWEIIHAGKWKELTDAKKYDHIGRFEFQIKSSDEYAHPAQVLREMSKHMGKDDVLCVDTGDITLWAPLAAVLTKGTRTLSSERMGTMGYALCAAFASCLVRGDTGRGVCVVGDGAVQMTINELGCVKHMFAKASASGINHKLLIIIFDNEKLGRVYFGFAGAQGCELGPSPDFVMLAKSYGGDGVRLSSPAEIPKVMKQAFDSTGIFLIHVIVDPTVKADMEDIHDNSIKMMNCG